MLQEKKTFSSCVSSVATGKQETITESALARIRAFLGGFRTDAICLSMRIKAAPGLFWDIQLMRSLVRVRLVYLSLPPCVLEGAAAQQLIWSCFVWDKTCWV